MNCFVMLKMVNRLPDKNFHETKIGLNFEENLN
jgi:hypothetical protein